MRRLVLDAGPLIALLSKKDNYHSQAKLGFAKLPRTFGEVLTPLPILFEVYKFVSRAESSLAAHKLLTLIQQETVIIPIEIETFHTIYNLVQSSSNWQGSLEDAAVLIVAQKFKAEIWTLDYKDLGFFKNVEFWTPSD